MIKSIVCGPFHTLVLTNSGRLFTTGLLLHNISSGEEFSNEFIELRYRMGKVEHISSGLLLNGALSSEGRMYIWGVLN